MKLPKLYLVEQGKKLINPGMNFYIKHKSVFLTGQTIGFGIASTALAIKNGRAILNTIDVAKEALSKSESKEERNTIYVATGKDLAPLIAPIVLFQTVSICSAIQMKRSTDKEISDLTDALAVTSNAIASYKAFKMEAEKELGEGKSKEIKEIITKESIKENPQSVDNTVNKMPVANNAWCYWDQTAKRYIWSDRSPVELQQWALDQSKALYDGAVDGDRININEFYEYVAPRTSIPAFAYNKEMCWYAADTNGRRDSDLINIDFYTTEGPDGRGINAFECNFLPFRG